MIRKASLLLVFSFVGYLLCYGPFAHLSNHASTPPDLSALAILPISSLSCMLTMLVLTALFGWWPHLRITIQENGQTKAHPAVWSSLFSVPILLGTPISYALKNVSMLVMGILMKAGSLATAPIADHWNKEKISKFSWASLFLCLGAILVSCFGNGVWTLSIPAIIIIVMYNGGYLGRLRQMVGQKGSMDFFVAEHMLQPVAAFLVVCVAALFSKDIRAGFTLWKHMDLWLIGIFSQGVGLFGGWMLLHKRESSFSMPLNRIAAIMANVGANLYVGNYIKPSSWVAVGLVCVAIVVLAIGSYEKAANSQVQQS